MLINEIFFIAKLQHELLLTIWLENATENYLF